MADDEVELGEGTDGAEGAPEPKKSGNGLIPKILKFVAIGLGAIIFIVTIVFITFGFLNGSGKQAAVIPQTDSYAAIKPVYATYDGVGTIMTRTRDPTPYNVVANPILEYDLNDNATQAELIGRKTQLIDFFRRYFSSKYQTELGSDNEAKVKNEIQELLNTTVLDKARVRGVLFTQFDLFETQ
ncbi:MAG: flagellar basal body protein FliL [Spirochaetaceae bacterium]|jgi:flagellar FliL protein|nr:flagellar basal body protein FliL [Spirochaetaceae bacterium]